MQGFTSGSSWECKEWFETFSSQFPNYTSPGIWIAAQERLHGLKSRKLTWDRTSRTVKLSLTNSRGQLYTLAMHFYPGSTPSVSKILGEAAKITGLIPCLASGDLPPALNDAIKASGEDVFLKNPGSIEFDPGMMSSECALLIAAFLEELEQEPGRWFRFINLNFAEEAEKLEKPAGQLAPEGGDESAPADGEHKPGASASRGDALQQEALSPSTPFTYASIGEIIRYAAAQIPELEVPAMEDEERLQRLRFWMPQPLPDVGTELIDALPSTGLSPLIARRSWCAFGDTEAREFLKTVVRASAHSVRELLGQLIRREERQERTPAVTVNPKWRKFLETQAEIFAQDASLTIDFEAAVLATLRLEAIIKAPPADHDEEKMRDLHVNAEAFLQSVLALTRRELLPMKPAFAIWHALSQTAAEIVAAGAVAPIPVHLSATECYDQYPGFRVFWIPAVSTPQVKTLLSEAYALTKGFLTQKKGGKTFLSGEDPAAEGAKMRAFFWCMTLITTAFVRNASEKNKEVSRLMIGRRVRKALTGDGFAPEPPAYDDLASVLSAFFALPLAAMTTPCRLVLAGELENGALKLTLHVKPRTGTEEKTAENEAKDSCEASGSLTITGWEKLGEDPDHRVRAAVELLAGTHPLFSEFGASFENPAWLPRSQWEYFLFTAMPALSAYGIEFDLPEALKKIEKPRIVLSASSAAKASPRSPRLATQGMLNAAALADFHWEIAVGDERMTLEELRARINAEGELITSGGALFHLSKADLDRLVLEWMEAQKKALTNWEKLRALLSGQIAGRTVEATEELLGKIREQAAVKELPLPQGLNATLRPYQVRGYSWLVQNALLGLGSLLADDMGLGKTVQVIAAVVELKNRGLLSTGRVIIAAPASLLVNWQREIERFAPGLTTQIFHGKERELDDGPDRPDILITSYGLLKREFPKLSELHFRLLVLDEAQAVKNSKTGQARAAQEFPADAVVALTGTPVENRLSEYWSIFSILEPGLLGTPAQFRREYVEPIKEHRDAGAIDRFRKITAPFLLRRVKTDPGILDELPEKNVVDYFTTLTPRQVALYEECLKENLEELETLDASAASADQSGRTLNAAHVRASRRGQILRMILHLKQISNSPSQFLKEISEKPDSGKAEALLELLHRCRESGRKALIFTQFREMGERLVRWIADATGKTPEFLHGGVPASKRMEMVDAFQNDPNAEVFVLSLKAGGTGLNLTAASAVIHYDLWWNPAVEDQASDRAWRIGQRRDVVVYRFITAGTFEEKVNEMLKKKRELADLAVGVGESWIGDLTDDEIKSIFSLSK